MTHFNTRDAALPNVTEAVRRCLRFADSRDRNEALYSEARALYLEGGAAELLQIATEVGVFVPKQVYDELPSSPP